MEVMQGVMLSGRGNLVRAEQQAVCWEAGTPTGYSFGAWQPHGLTDTATPARHRLSACTPCGEYC
jgi:hypothetical protein